MHKFYLVSYTLIQMYQSSIISLIELVHPYLFSCRLPLDQYEEGACKKVALQTCNKVTNVGEQIASRQTQLTTHKQQALTMMQ